MLAPILCRHTNGFESFELFNYKFGKHAQKDFGIRSQWRYLLQADALWGSNAIPANHMGPPFGIIEECVREFDYMFLRYNNQSQAISFLRYNLIQTYYREPNREEFLEECAREEEEANVF